ncbi:hypothetical protein BH20ACT4_BH20ACT4_03450 [soil metagenome]
MNDFLPEIPDEYVAAHDAAIGLSQDPTLHRAFGELLGDPRLAAKAARDPASFLAGYDIRVPDGLVVSLIGFGKPGPDWVPFTIRLTNCRTYRRRDPQTGKFEEAEVCFGFEITPNPMPGGPWG